MIFFTVLLRFYFHDDERALEVPLCPNPQPPRQDVPCTRERRREPGTPNRVGLRQSAEIGKQSAVRKKAPPRHHKHLSEPCPRCMTRMPYVRVPSRMRQWSPRPYAWHCTRCTEVWVLDGAIDSEHETWERRKKRQQREALLKAAMSFFKPPTEKRCQ